MKVLQIVRQYKPSIGGLQNFVHELAVHLKSSGIHTEVLTLNKDFSDGRPLPEYSVESGIKVRRISYFGSKRYPIALSTLKYLSEFDLIHIHAVDSFIDYLSWLKPLHKKPIVLSTHGGFFHTKQQESMKKIYFNTITKMTLKKANRVIACSNNDYDLFRPIMSGKLDLIENGINFHQYSLISEKTCDQPHFIFVGRFSQNKRIDQLIELVHRLAPKFPAIKLRILGKDFDGLKGQYDRMIDAYHLDGKVEIYDSVSDEKLLELMADSQYFISASEYEGFGLSAMEAMAAGRIPLLSNIPSFRKMIDDEKNGYLLDFKNMEATAEKVARVLETDRKKPIVRSAINYAENYSWQSVVKNFEKVYAEVCAT